VNEGKYRVLSDSLIAAFSGPTKSMQPIQIGQMARSPDLEGAAPPSSMVVIDTPIVGIEDGTPLGGESDEHDPEATGDTVAEEAAPVDQTIIDEDADPQGAGAMMADVDAIADRMEDSLQSLIEQKMVEVRRKGDWLEVEFKTAILFSSGSARLKGAAMPVLGKFAENIRQFPNPIQVEGFTDNVPIHTVAYPSNWELSAARAASVVHLLMKDDVHPKRMMAIGYGEHRPIADNNTAEGRIKNRRVVIVIPADKHTRRVLDMDRMVDPAGRQVPD
ncbi:MAG: OmpA family protein, partial [Gammaproteobacteria bacterium]|nr:OmpA family protein [Gammaproteobacteria bacterium]